MEWGNIIRGEVQEGFTKLFFFGWGGIPCRTKGVIIVDENDLTQTEQKTLQKNERGRYIVNQYFYLDQHIWKIFLFFKHGKDCKVSARVYFCGWRNADGERNWKIVQQHWRPLNRFVW